MQMTLWLQVWFSHKRRKDKQTDVIHEKVLGVGLDAVRVPTPTDPLQPLKDALKSTPSTPTGARAPSKPLQQPGRSAPITSALTANGSGTSELSQPLGTAGAPHLAAMPSGGSMASPGVQHAHSGGGYLQSHPSAEQQQQRLQQQQRQLQQQQANIQLQHEQALVQERFLAQQDRQRQYESHQAHLQQQQYPHSHSTQHQHHQLGQEQLQQQQQAAMAAAAYAGGPPAGSPAWNDPQMHLQLQLLHRMHPGSHPPGLQTSEAPPFSISPAAVAQRTNILAQAAMQTAAQNAAHAHARRSPNLSGAASFGSSPQNSGSSPMPGPAGVHLPMPRASSHGHDQPQGFSPHMRNGSGPNMPQHMQHAQLSQPASSLHISGPAYPAGYPQRHGLLASKHSIQQPSASASDAQISQRASHGPAEHAAIFNDARHPSVEDQAPSQGQSRLAPQNPASLPQVHHQPSNLSRGILPEQQASTMQGGRDASQQQMPPQGQERLQALLGMTPHQHSQLSSEPRHMGSETGQMGSELASHPSMTPALRANLLHTQGVSEQHSTHSQHHGIPPSASQLQSPGHHSGQLLTYAGRSRMSPVEALKHGLYNQNPHGYQSRTLPGPSRSSGQVDAQADPMEEDEDVDLDEPEDEDADEYEDDPMDDEAKRGSDLNGHDYDEDHGDIDHPHAVQHGPSQRDMEDRQAYYAPVPRPTPLEAGDQAPALGARGAVAYAAHSNGQGLRTGNALQQESRASPGGLATSRAHQASSSEQARYRQQQQMFTQQLQQGQTKAASAQQLPVQASHNLSQPQPKPALEPSTSHAHPEGQNQPGGPVPKAPGKVHTDALQTAKPAGAILLAAGAKPSQRPASQAKGTPHPSGSEDEETEDEAEALQACTLHPLILAWMRLVYMLI